MKQLAIFLSLSLVLSCESSLQKSDIKSNRQIDYIITIKIWNSLKPHQTKYILDNTWIGQESTIEKMIFLKPLTLYRISYDLIIDSTSLTLTPTDTTKFNFSRDQSAQLFFLTKEYFRSIEFDTEDVSVNGEPCKPVFDDRAEISLSDDRLSLTSTIYNLHSQLSSNKPLQKLVEFIAPYHPDKNE